MKIQISITDEMRQLLGCEGNTLESIFVETEPSRSTIIVFRVDPARNSSNNPPSVVKFSEHMYAIPVSEHLKMSTASYFREYEKDASDRRDEEEARCKADILPLLSKYGSGNLRGVASMSGHVTYGVDDFWLFCTSQQPKTARGLEQMRRRFSAECVTAIPDPSAFARELGTAFASRFSWSDVDLSSLDKLIRAIRPSEIGDKVVWLYHGPVCYSDDPQELIETFDPHHRPAVVPFIKRRKFAWQQEYRFAVKTNGAPKDKELFIATPAELRGLA